MPCFLFWILHLKSVSCSVQWSSVGPIKKSNPNPAPRPPWMFCCSAGLLHLCREGSGGKGSLLPATWGARTAHSWDFREGSLLRCHCGLFTLEHQWGTFCCSWFSNTRNCLLSPTFQASLSYAVSFPEVHSSSSRLVFGFFFGFHVWWKRVLLKCVVTPHLPSPWTAQLFINTVLTSRG